MRIKRAKIEKKNLGSEYIDIGSKFQRMQGERKYQNDFLQFYELQAMDENKKIGVNSNYIYWALMKFAQQKKKQNVLDLKRQINKIDDERQLYVPMSVKEVKKCFTPIYKDMPNQMFKKI